MNKCCFTISTTTDNLEVFSLFFILIALYIELLNFSGIHFWLFNSWWHKTKEKFAWHLVANQIQYGKRSLGFKSLCLFPTFGRWRSLSFYREVSFHYALLSHHYGKFTTHPYCGRRALLFRYIPILEPTMTMDAFEFFFLLLHQCTKQRKNEKNRNVYQMCTKVCNVDNI